MSDHVRADGTVVLLHAHPDDESLLTGALMARAADCGVRTVVVYGTRGDAGETGLDLGGETLGARRVREAESACAALGVARVIWLPFEDSGMAGTPTNTNPSAFSSVPTVEVAATAARALADETVDIVVGYDANGTYGHPDHQQVHRVAHALAPLVGAAWVLEATYHREYLASLPDSDGSLDRSFAASEAELTHFLQDEELLARKISALAHHRSQVPEDWDIDNPDVDRFRARFGTEWFIATPYEDSDDLGPLNSVVQPKDTWPGPLAVPN